MNAVSLALVAAVGRQPRHPIHLAESLGLEADECRRRLGQLERRGLVCRKDGAGWQATPAGRAACAAGRAAPAANTLRQRLWTAVRKLRKATIADLVTLAAGAEKNAPQAARKYMSALARAGYVRTLARRGGHGQLTYVLVRDSGPRAPAYSHRAGSILDPNTGEVHRTTR